MSSNRLSLNPNKTEIIWLTPSRRKHSIERPDLHISDKSVPPSTVVRNLGVLVDDTLTLIPHINRLISVSFYYLRQIKTIRRFLSISNARLLTSGLILSRIDYCNSILFALPACHLQRLQTVLNSSARLIFNRSKFDHATPLLLQLHWLRVPERIKFKVCLLTYKTLHALAPAYLTQFCNPLSAVTGPRAHLRSAAAGNLILPKFKTKFGTRSFSHSGPALWNSLPLRLKSAPTVGQFISMLKTSLFPQSFPDAPSTPSGMSKRS